MAASAVWRPASSNSMATMQLPAMGYGLRYEHGIFQQKIRNGWQEERPDNWLRHPDPWEVVRPAESVEVTFGCSFELRAGALRMIPNSPSTLVGVPYDRPVVGYGGKTVNTLRLWSATASEGFDFQRFSGGDFVASIAEALNAESLTRVLYPDDHTHQGRALRLMQEYFLVACSLGDIVRQIPRIELGLGDAARKGGHPDERHPPDPGGAGADAHSARRSASRVGRGVRPHQADARLHQSYAAARGARALAGRVDAVPHSAPARDHLRDQPAPAWTTFASAFRATTERRAGSAWSKRARRSMSGWRISPSSASHSTNGVAAIHSEASPQDDGPRSRRGLSRAFQQQDQRGDAAALAPARQSPPRRDDLRRHRRRLDRRPQPIEELRPLADDAAFRAKILAAKRVAKARFADWVKRHTDVVVDPDTIFDCQIKRIHEYKRQLLNALQDRRSLRPAAREPEPRRSRREPSSSPARPRPPITWPRSSSSSSTIWRTRSTAIRRFAAS